MSLLKWDKPEKKMSVEEWKSITADSAPYGVYMPNMSDDDKMAWKAKLVGHKSGDPRVEIRKTSLNGVQMLLVIRLESVRISLNGTAEFQTSFGNDSMVNSYDAIQLAVDEARDKLNNIPS